VSYLSWLKEFFLTNIESVRKDDMIPPVLMTMAANFVMDLVKDKAQSLASEHIEKALDNAPKELKEAFDKAVNDDGTHEHKSLMDLIK